MACRCTADHQDIRVSCSALQRSHARVGDHRRPDSHGSWAEIVFVVSFLFRFMEQPELTNDFFMHVIRRPADALGRMAGARLRGPSASR